MRRRDFLALSTLGMTNASVARGLLADSAGTNPPRRLVCIGLDLSLRPEGFFPSDAGPDYATTPLLEPIERWRGKLSVFSQLDHPGVNGGHNAVQAWLCGIRQEQAAGFPQGILTLDQLVAAEIGHATRFPSLCLGIGGGDSISWTRAGIAVPKIAKPREAFDLIFRPRPETEREAKRQSFVADQSAVELVRQDIARMKSLLDVRDRNKLEEFQTSLDEFETGLKRSEVWLDRPYPTTESPAPGPGGDGCMDDVRTMLDVSTLALQADATRVISFNIGYGLPVANRVPGVSQSYHDLSHSGQDPEKLRQLRIVEERLMKELDRFLGKLDSIHDQQRSSLLDQTLVLFGSGMGNASSHSNRNLPILIAGGGLKHGKHLFFEKKGRKQTPLCNLYVTLLNQLGLNADRFGTSDGNLNELLV